MIPFFCIEKHPRAVMPNLKEATVTFKLVPGVITATSNDCPALARLNNDVGSNSSYNVLYNPVKLGKGTVLTR